MKYPKQLEAARSEAEKAVIRVRTVKQKIEEKTEELMGAGGDVVGLELDVRRQLAKAEVDGDSAVNAPSQAKLDEAKRGEKRLRLLIDGLRHDELPESEQALRDAGQRFLAADREFMNGRIEELKALFSKELGELLRQRLRPIAAEYIGLLGLPVYKLQDVKFPTLDSRDSLPLIPQKREDGRSVETLLDERECRKLYDGHADLRRVRTDVESELEKIRKTDAQVDAEASTADSERSRGLGVRHVSVTPSPTKKVPENERGSVEHYEHGIPIGRDRGRFFEALDLHEQGKTAAEIAEQLKHYPRTIESWIDTYEGYKNRALELRDAGKSAEQIAEAIHWPLVRVERWLQRERASVSA